MNSRRSARTGSQVARIELAPRGLVGAGQDAVELATLAGLQPDPWQQRVIQKAQAETQPGRWAASEVGVFVPRQNGKGTLIEIRVLAGLFLYNERLVVWTAHEYKTAQEGFLRMRDLIRGAPAFHAKVKRYWEGSGEQGIELKTGQRLRFLARSKGSGRGFSGDTVILDEAQWLDENQMRALMSTLSARPNPQIWYTGTPPLDPAAWIYGLRQSAISKQDRLAYFDWGVDLDLDQLARDPSPMADRDNWYAANPALGIRLSESFCETEMARLGLGFASERLGVWAPRSLGNNRIIGADLWRGLADRDTERPTQLAFAVCVNTARTYGCIAAAGPRTDGLIVTSIVDHRAGTDWIAPRLAQLRERWSPVAIASDPGPGSSLLLELEREGLAPAEKDATPARGDLLVMSSTDVAAAFGTFVDRVRQKELIHADDAPLNLAIDAAAVRSLAGGSAWDYRGTADTAPLIAATNAVWAYVTRAPLVTKPYNALNFIM